MTLSMCLFALSMSISPGPVNFITLSTGVNHGIRPAMPFVAGATIGFTLLLLTIGLGLGTLAGQSQFFLKLLAYGGSGFMCYIGYKIAVSAPDIKIEKVDPAPFYQGFILQWLNPKAWAACLAGVSAFNLTSSSSILAIFVAQYFVICFASIALWALLGAKMTLLVNTSQKLIIFNRIMGGSLVLVALYLLFMQLATAE